MPPSSSSPDKARRHRQRQRAQGLRRVEFWVPDVRTAAFRLEAHRQSANAAADTHARDDQDFIDAISVD